jgi:hypothetical protein
MTEYVRQAALQIRLGAEIPSLHGSVRCSKGSRRFALEIAARGWTFCSHFVLLSHLGGDSMSIEKQREVIRLWNELRKVEGPAAEELRIQILECFSEKDKVKKAA